jgi:hypothetical protein
MKKMLKNTYLLVLAVALTFVACKDAEPVVDTAGKDDMAAARETLTVADAYYHGDVYATGGGSYKITLTLLSEGMGFVYDSEDENNVFDSYSGTGYAFEIQFNSEFEDSIAPGVYTADTMDFNQEYWMCDLLTYNPENTYLTVVNSGSGVKNVLDGNVTIDVKVSGDIYTITIDGKNAIDMPVKGTYVGKINPRDIYYYREPETADNVEINAESVTYLADEDNKSNYAYYASMGYEALFKSTHYITVEGENGEMMKLVVSGGALEWTSLAAGDYALRDGMWDLEMQDDGGNWVIDPDKDYRADGVFYGSYMIYNDEVYYLSGSTTIEFEGTIVTALSLNAISAVSGMEVTIDYTKATE